MFGMSFQTGARQSSWQRAGADPLFERITIVLVFYYRIETNEEEMEVELSDTESIAQNGLLVPRKYSKVSVEINSAIQNPTTRSISIVSSVWKNVSTNAEAGLRLLAL